MIHQNLPPGFMVHRSSVVVRLLSVCEVSLTRAFFRTFIYRRRNWTPSAAPYSSTGKEAQPQPQSVEYRGHNIWWKPFEIANLSPSILKCILQPLRRWSDLDWQIKECLAKQKAQQQIFNPSWNILRIWTFWVKSAARGLFFFKINFSFFSVWVFSSSFHLIM
jgi:hypothetical protein